MSTNLDQSFSEVPDCPLHEIDVRPVVDFEVGGTTPALESLELEAGAPDCACVKSRWNSKKTRECVREGVRDYFQYQHHLFWEMGVDYVLTPRESVHVILKL